MNTNPTHSCDQRAPRTRLGRAGTVLAASSLAVFLAGPARAQEVRFSIDSASASIGPPISAGAVLAPSAGAPALGPLAAPLVRFHPTLLGLAGPPWEVDAISQGSDAKFDPLVAFAAGKLWFSVDRRSHGRAFPATWPTVRTEIVPFPLREASQDVFVNLDPVLAMTAGPGFLRHVGVLDGDGLPSLTSGYAYPGLGLAEPGALDNLDALDIIQPGPTVVYYSVSQTTGAAHGVLAGDVLVADTAAAVPAFALYAAANQLGLDLIGGPNSDNLDALVLWENGDGVYAPMPNGWHGWGPADGNDRLLFSVHRNSAIIGQVDAFLGIPIAAGDILMPPPMGFGGLPGIFVRAEQLGLRSARAAMADFAPDDLVALDVAPAAAQPLFDCNGNGIEDAVDIANGTEADADMNGIPDVCMPAAPVVYCTASLNSCGTPLAIGASGTASASAGSGFVVQVADVDGGMDGMLFYGFLGPASLPTGMGTLCVATPTYTTIPVVDTVGTAGACNGVLSIDMNAFAVGALGGAPQIALTLPGVTVNCQYYVHTATGGTVLSDAVEYLIGL